MTQDQTTEPRRLRVSDFIVAGCEWVTISKSAVKTWHCLTCGIASRDQTCPATAILAREAAHA